MLREDEDKKRIKIFINSFKKELNEIKPR